ncbi:aspartate kinase, partial [Vibrio parahaemolyticus]|nr:aspartate kinase [Vibrio parahaemolyticus]
GSHSDPPNPGAPGVLARLNRGVTPVALHSSLRNVNVQCVVSDKEYQRAIWALHDELFTPVEGSNALEQVASLMHRF